MINEVSKVFLEYTAITACKYMEDTIDDNLGCDELRSDRIAIIWGVAALSLAAYATRFLIKSKGSGKITAISTEISEVPNEPSKPSDLASKNLVRFTKDNKFLLDKLVGDPNIWKKRNCS